VLACHAGKIHPQRSLCHEEGGKYVLPHHKNYTGSDRGYHTGVIKQEHF